MYHAELSWLAIFWYDGQGQCLEGSDEIFNFLLGAGYRPLLNFLLFDAIVCL